MFRAIGFVIVLLVLANLFTAAFVAFERALVATFSAVEDAAEAASVELSQQTNQH